MKQFMLCQGINLITLIRDSTHDPYIIKLSVRDTLWDQYAYQFAHEFCHVLC